MVLEYDDGIFYESKDDYGGPTVQNIRLYEKIQPVILFCGLLTCKYDVIKCFIVCCNWHHSKRFLLFNYV